LPEINLVIRTAPPEEVDYCAKIEAEIFLFILED